MNLAPETFGQVQAFGNAYHGLVTGRSVALPNGETKDLPGEVDSPATCLFSRTDAPPAPAPSTADTAAGQAFWNAVLLHSRARCYPGVYGGFGPRAWRYIAPDGTPFRIRVYHTQVDSTVTTSGLALSLIVYAARDFAQMDASYSETSIGSLAATAKSAGTKKLWSPIAYPHPNGHKAVVNLRGGTQTEYTTSQSTANVDPDDDRASWDFCGACEVAISGGSASAMPTATITALSDALLNYTSSTTTIFGVRPTFKWTRDSATVHSITMVEFDANRTDSINERPLMVAYQTDGTRVICTRRQSISNGPRTLSGLSYGDRIEAAFPDAIKLGVAVTEEVETITEELRLNGATVASRAGTTTYRMEWASHTYNSTNVSENAVGEIRYSNTGATTTERRLAAELVKRSGQTLTVVSNAYTGTAIGDPFTHPTLPDSATHLIKRSSNNTFAFTVFGAPVYFKPVSIDGTSPGDPALGYPNPYPTMPGTEKNTTPWVSWNPLTNQFSMTQGTSWI